MGKSQRLRLRDLRNIYRLIGECRDLGRDPRGWQSHLLQGLCRLVGAQAAGGGHVYGLFGKEPYDARLLTLGWAEPLGEKLWWQFVHEEDPDEDPLFAQMVPLLQRRGGLLTRRRQDLVADRDWRSSVHVNEYRRPGKVDECLYSYDALGDGDQRVLSVIELYRAAGDPAFDRRERAVVDTLHRELAPLIGRQLASARELSIGDLPPRLVQVLLCLVEGDSEKQIARRLGLSRSTVHEYVTDLYRRFGVHSRGELLARWYRFDRNG